VIRGGAQLKLFVDNIPSHRSRKEVLLFSFPIRLLFVSSPGLGRRHPIPNPAAGNAGVALCWYAFPLLISYCLEIEVSIVDSTTALGRERSKLKIDSAQVERLRAKATREFDAHKLIAKS